MNTSATLATRPVNDLERRAQSRFNIVDVADDRLPVVAFQRLSTVALLVLIASELPADGAQFAIHPLHAGVAGAVLADGAGEGGLVAVLEVFHLSLRVAIRRAVWSRLVVSIFALVMWVPQVWHSITCRPLPFA